MKATTISRTGTATAVALPFALAVALIAAEVEPKTYEHVAIPSGEHQLFLNDFLVGALHRVARRIHQPAKYQGNPLIRADQPWEGSSIQTRSAPLLGSRRKGLEVLVFRRRPSHWLRALQRRHPLGKAHSRQG